MCIARDVKKRQRSINSNNKPINMIHTMIGTINHHDNNDRLKRTNSVVSSSCYDSSSATTTLSKKRRICSSSTTTSTSFLEQQQQHCLSSSILQQQQYPQQQQRKEKKHVNFSLESNVIIEYIPLCCEKTQEEIDQQWISKTELLSFQRTANEDARSIQYMEQQQQQQQHSFTQAYTNMYSLCHNNNNNHTNEGNNKDNSDSSIAMMELLVASCHNNQLNTTSRGIEDHIIVNIGINRRILRKELIQSICSISKLMNMNCISQNEYNENTLLLCHISQSLSSSARQLSEYIGIIDSTIAMMEYM